VAHELERWAGQAVEGHFSGTIPWADYGEPAAMLAGRLVGAQPGEAVMMNGLTANLHAMLATFWQPQGRRRKILIERGAFPSDRHAVRSHIGFRGFDPDEVLVEVGPAWADDVLAEGELEAVVEGLGEDLALVVLPGVQFRTGQALDVRRLTAAAHEVGALAGWDMAHAAGNLGLALHDDGADFAVWCSYKYLNSGPGSVGGCFVHSRHHGRDLPRMAGWWGHRPDTRFAMAPDFDPSPDARGWQLSNVPVLCTAPFLVSATLFDHVGMETLRARGQWLHSRLRLAVQDACGGRVHFVTPATEGEHGCQLTLRVQAPVRQVQTLLREAGIVCDVRTPDLIRVAAVPHYNLARDVDEFAVALRAALDRC
jgi:kynureninase